MKRLLQLFIGTCLMTCSHYSLSQPAYKAEYYLTENGLPSNAIQSCAADSTGYLWLATGRGLCRFDGYIFQNAKGTKGNFVSMQATAGGELIAYNNNTGLGRFNPYTNTYTTIAAVNFSDADPDNDHYNNVFTDNEGRIWCCDFKNIKYFIAGSGQSKSFPVSSFNNSTDRLACFTNPLPGKVWAAGISGLFTWDKKDDTLRRNSNPVLQYLSYSAATTTGRDTVALAAGNTIYLVKVSDNSIISKTTAGTEEDRIISITVSKSSAGKMIIAASKSRVFCSNKNMTAYTAVFSSSYTGSVINSVAAAATKHIWVCTNHGLIKLTPDNDAVISYRLPGNDFREDNVTAILPAGNNYFYISTSGGHFYYTNFTEWNNITLPAKTIIHQLSYYNSSLLLSTSAGLYQYINGRVIKLLFKKEYDNTGIKKALVTDKNIWLLPAVSLPVIALDKTTLKIDAGVIIKNNYIFSSNNVWNDIAADHTGNIFLAGWIPDGYGLAEYEKDSSGFVAIAKRTTNGQLFIGDYYNRVVPSKQFNLLFTGYGGFNMVNEQGRLTNIVSVNDHPLANEHAEGILAMPDSSIWFGTEEGIQVWNPATDNTLLITTLNGLPYNNALFAFEHVAANTIAAGFNKVVSFINTKTLFNSSFVNKLALSKVVVNGIERAPKDNSIEVSPDERNITLYFSALNFANTNNVHYQYRINNGEWQLLGNNPSFVFSNFKNGRYNITVKATDDLQNTQEKNLVVSINALPFYYETTLFKILLPAGIILLLFFIFLLRIRQLKKWNAFRASLSQDLHDDAGATLSSVNILSTLIAEQEPLSPKAALYMQRITEDVKMLQLKLDEIIWSLKNNTGNIHQVYTRLEEYGSFLMEAKNIHFTATSSPDPGHITLPIKKLRNLFLTGKEALNNIAKHSGATEAALSIIILQNSISITIADNGKGIDTQKIAARNGITGMYSRIKEAGGSVSIDTSPEGGTKIFITLKYK